MKHFLLFLAIILATGTIAQNTFFQEYPDEAYQVGTDIFALDNGNYVVAGYSILFKAGFLTNSAFFGMSGLAGCKSRRVPGWSASGKVYTQLSYAMLSDL